jgi:hypothetical protein
VTMKAFPLSRARMIRPLSLRSSRWVIRRLIAGHCSTHATRRQSHPILLLPDASSRFLRSAGSTIVSIVARSVQASGVKNPPPRARPNAAQKRPRCLSRTRSADALLLSFPGDNVVPISVRDEVRRAKPSPISSAQ